MALVRTAKSCRSDAPMLASSLREEAQTTVSNKPGHREEHEVSRKTIARGMPVRSGVTVVTTLGCLFSFGPEAAAHRAPGIPCALYSRSGERSCKPRANHAAGSRSHISTRRHCEERSDEAIHTYFAATWIASLALAMTPQHAP